MKKVEIIAEIGQAHEGSLGLLYSYIDALSVTGVDCIKFQVHIAEAESSSEEKFRINFSKQDETRFDYWKRMEFSTDQWKEIKLYTEGKGLEFLASPFSIKAVDLLEQINVNRYKLGSGEVSNFLILDKIAKTRKPIIISSGMSSFAEIESAVEIIKKYHTDITILQCTTSYPTPAEEIGLNVIQELKQRFPNYRVGLSEHTGEIATGIAAAAIGAEVLEFHVVFDKRMFGPDTSSSLTIDDTSELVRSVRFLEKALYHTIDKNNISKYKDLKQIFEKSLAVNRDMEKGDIISIDDLESKKPANMGIPAKKYEKVLGQKLTRKLTKYSFLNYEDLAND